MCDPLTEMVLRVDHLIVSQPIGEPFVTIEFL